VLPVIQQSSASDKAFNNYDRYHRTAPGAIRMPSASPSQRIAEISKELEILRAQSLDHPEKTAELLQDSLEKIQIRLKELTTLTVGMTEAERDAFVEDKLACEHEKHLRQQEKLLDAMTRLQQLGTVFVREGELEPVLGEIVDAAIAISGANFGNIQILDPKSSELKIMAHRGFPEWWIDYWNSVTKGQGACGTALEQGARIIVDNVEQSPIFIGTPALEIQLKADVRAVQSTPLVSRSGRPLGIFSTHYKTPHRPDDNELRLLDLLASQAADIIERAQAEEALRESEARLRRIAAAGHIGFFEWDASRDTAYWSPEHYELFGFEPGSPISWQRWLQGVHPDDRERVVENAARLLERARSEGQVQGHKDEYRFIRSEGSVVWLEADLSVEMVAGEPIIRGSVRDITERKRAEESEERLRALMDHNPSLIFLKDESGRYVYLNKAYERQFALSKDWYGKTDFDFWPEESAELFRINDSVVLKSGQIHQFIEDSTDLEGIRHCWHCYKFPFVDSKNERYVGGIGIDATDRIRAEEDLHLAYARLQTFFDHRIGGIGIVIANARGSILQANDYYLSILGYTREELLSGQVDWRKMTPPEWLPADERALAQLQEQGVCNTYEKEYIRRDGTRVPVLVTDAKMPGDSGDILAFVFDVIERKKAEEALRKSKDELEQRVQERTADLVKVNEELMAAKEAAEASVRAKAAFLANMSHELRTPLNSIMGFTNLLLEEPLPVEYRDWLDTMKINSEALLALINDVLDFSKMEKDKVELETHPFNLRERIEESLDLVSAKAAEKGLDLAYICIAMFLRLLSVIQPGSGRCSPICSATL